MTGKTVDRTFLILFFLMIVSVVVTAAPDICEYTNAIGRMNQTINLTPGIPTTVSDTATVDLTLAAADLKADVLPGGIDHGGLADLLTDDHTQYILVLGTRAFTGTQSAGGFTISNLMNPLQPQDAATKNYVDIQKANDTTYATAQPFAANDTALFYNDTTFATNFSALFYNDTVYAGNFTALFRNDTAYAANFSALFKNDTAYAANFSQLYVPLTNISYVLTDGRRAMTANLSMGGYNISNVNLTPVGLYDAATKNYVDIQKANDTAYATSASVSAGIATAEAYSDSNLSRTSSVTMSRFFLANETVFSNTATYPLRHVFNSTTVLADVICIGAGGGSGGVTGVASQTAAAGGGGAGGYVEAWFSVTPSTSAWIGVGKGGSGSAAAAANGAAGAPSNFTIPGGTKWINCSGGVGGTGQAAGTTFAGAAGGIGGGTVVMGAIGPQWINYGMNQTGMNGYRLSATAAIPGSGGSTTLGDGAIPPIAAGGGTACPPGGYGGGAAGALSTAAVNQAGGAGCPGAIIIREYASGWPAGGAK